MLTRCNLEPGTPPLRAITMPCRRRGITEVPPPSCTALLLHWGGVPSWFQVTLGVWLVTKCPTSSAGDLKVSTSVIRTIHLSGITALDKGVRIIEAVMYMNSCMADTYEEPLEQTVFDTGFSCFSYLSYSVLLKKTSLQYCAPRYALKHDRQRLSIYWLEV